MDISIKLGAAGQEVVTITATAEELNALYEAADMAQSSPRGVGVSGCPEVSVQAIRKGEED